MHGVSVRRAFALVFTVFVYAVVLTAVCLQIVWPWTHDGCLSPSELAARPFNPERRELVWVAGTVVNCHAMSDNGSVVYTLANEIGSNPARVNVQWRPSDGTTYSTGTRVGFSGERIAPMVVLASADLFRAPVQ